MAGAPSFAKRNAASAEWVQERRFSCYEREMELLLVVDSALLDGEAALVVLDVALEAGDVVGGGSDGDARVACEDNVL